MEKEVHGSKQELARPQLPNERFSSRLGSFLKGISSPFVCGGKIKLDETPVIHLLETDESIVIQPAKKPQESIGSWGDGATEKRLHNQINKLKGLTSKMPRASFGHGKETVYDDSVRCALQLKAENFDINIPQEKIEEVLTTIKTELQLNTDIIAERYSLNVYEKGGKFVKHKDTPRGEDMLGTLVFCLPSLFKGGPLKVTMGHIVRDFFNFKNYSFEEAKGGCEAWWGTWREKFASDVISWCAFFADVDHEIHEVKSGVRVTVAYLLRRKDKQSAIENIPHELQLSEQAALIKQELVVALKMEDFFEGGGIIGYPCLHLYTNTEVFPRKKDCSDPLSTTQINKLKGRDLMVAEAAQAVGLSIRLVPFLGHTYSRDGGDGDYELKKFPKKKRPPGRMSDDTIHKFFNTEEQCNPEYNADVWILDYDDEEVAQMHSGACEWNSDGYFGNEASYIEFYVKACLFLDVPPYSEIRGIESQKGSVKKLKTKKRKTTK